MGLFQGGGGPIRRWVRRRRSARAANEADVFGGLQEARDGWAELNQRYRDVHAWSPTAARSLWDNYAPVAWWALQAAERGASEYQRRQAGANLAPIVARNRQVGPQAAAARARVEAQLGAAQSGFLSDVWGDLGTVAGEVGGEALERGSAVFEGARARAAGAFGQLSTTARAGLTGLGILGAAALPVVGDLPGMAEVGSAVADHYGGVGTLWSAATGDPAARQRVVGTVIRDRAGQAVERAGNFLDGLPSFFGGGASDAPAGDGAGVTPDPMDSSSFMDPSGSFPADPFLPEGGGPLLAGSAGAPAFDGLPAGDGPTFSGGGGDPFS